MKKLKKFTVPEPYTLERRLPVDGTSRFHLIRQDTLRFRWLASANDLAMSSLAPKVAKQKANSRQAEFFLFFSLKKKKKKKKNMCILCTFAAEKNK